MVVADVIRKVVTSSAVDSDALSACLMLLIIRRQDAGVADRRKYNRITRITHIRGLHARQPYCRGTNKPTDRLPVPEQLHPFIDESEA